MVFPLSAAAIAIVQASAEYDASDYIRVAISPVYTTAKARRGFLAIYESKTTVDPCGHPKLLLDSTSFSRSVAANAQPISESLGKHNL